MQKKIYGELKIFSGTAHPGFGNKICDYLNIKLGKAELFKFSNDNTFVRILENIREKDVFIIQPASSPVNDNLMELLIFIDAARRASAGRISAVIPYFPYGRTDKKDQPRVPITARLVADLLTVSGADRILTLDLHAGQIQGFFNIPVDELTASSILANKLKSIMKKDKDYVVVATDLGGAKIAREIATILKTPIAIIDKARNDNSEKVMAHHLIGDVAGRDAFIVDDEIGTGGTIVSSFNVLKANFAKNIYCASTHGIFSNNAIRKLSDIDIKNYFITDSIPQDYTEYNKFKEVSVANLFGEAIKRIHEGSSVGELFNNNKNK
ncbi:MAG: ribose-phosphate pyrophosphokinase [Chloroflexi bacterium]|nr:ribose-phosphate pyrophosphokinase [Chloroflexota bacterium]|tara:strand:+ start:6656 stop:7627 length:972 start_codon:yes stop_codon:yes gene_type:complete